MTIGIYLSSRGNFNQLFSLIVQWQTYAVDNSQITYLIGADADDEQTLKFPQAENTHVVAFPVGINTQGSRSKFLERVMLERKLDYYISINDHTYNSTQNWDQKIPQMMRYEHIMGLLDTNEPDGFNVSCVTHKWLEAANQYEPELYPFWFCDAWRLELARYVFLREPIRTNFVQVGGRHGKSKSLRDLDFWWGLFYAQRPQRLKMAFVIAQTFGTAPQTFEEFKESRREFIRICTYNDLGIRLKLDEMEAFFGMGGEASDKYLLAKAAAENYMKENDLHLWETRW